jgi:hypothetical protein
VTGDTESLTPFNEENLHLGNDFHGDRTGTTPSKLQTNRRPKSAPQSMGSLAKIVKQTIAPSWRTQQADVLNLGLCELS